MPPDDDVALIRRVAAKDRQAFEALYHRYYPRLSGYLFRLVRRKDIVEELLNDVMFVVWESAARFTGKSQVSTWIFGIAYHKALKALARLSEKPPEPPAAARELTDRNGPEDVMMRKEICDTLNRALDALSPEQRAVLELTFQHGFSYRAIAEVIGCPVNTVKTRMFYACRRLRQLLPRLGIHSRLG